MTNHMIIAMEVCHWMPWNNTAFSNPEDSEGSLSFSVSSLCHGFYLEGN